MSQLHSQYIDNLQELQTLVQSQGLETEGLADAVEVVKVPNDEHELKSQIDQDTKNINLLQLQLEYAEKELKQHKLKLSL